jgi:hypothetical protein
MIQYRRCGQRLTKELASVFLFGGCLIENRLTWICRYRQDHDQIGKRKRQGKQDVQLQGMCLLFDFICDFQS